MATFEGWIDGLLEEEGGFSPADNTAGAVSFGITEKFLKEHNIDLTGDGWVNALDVKALTVGDAKAIYREYFWDKMGLEYITDQQIANLIGHMAVNQGIGTAVMFAQHALNDRGCDDIKVDGIMGPITRKEVNTWDGQNLHNLIRFYALSRYVDLAVNHDPKLYGDDLKGWYNRLMKL